MIGDATLFQTGRQHRSGMACRAACVRFLGQSNAPEDFPNYAAGSQGPHEADETVGQGRTGLASDQLVQRAVQARYLRNSSYITTAPALATFSECFRPSMGMRTCVSQAPAAPGQARRPHVRKEHRLGSAAASRKCRRHVIARFDGGDFVDLRPAALATVHAAVIGDASQGTRSSAPRAVLRNRVLRRTGSDSTQQQALDACAVGGAKERADVIHAANIIEQDRDGQAEDPHTAARPSVAR